MASTDSRAPRDPAGPGGWPGGTLAQAQKDWVHLDAAELWGLQGRPSKPGSFKVFPVVLHELGHVLGLSHSNLEADVMSPYYRPDLTDLSENDVARARRATGADQAAAAAAGEEKKA